MVLNSHEDRFVTTQGGWTCGTCGQWVPDYMSHVCPNKPPYQQYTFPPAEQTKEDQILAKLDELLRLLKRIT